jgi:hypothetical protein
VRPRPNQQIFFRGGRLTDGCSAAAAREPPYHRSAADGASHPGPSGGPQGRRTPTTAAVSCSSWLGGTKAPHHPPASADTPTATARGDRPKRAPAERGAPRMTRPPATRLNRARHSPEPPGLTRWRTRTAARPKGAARARDKPAARSAHHRPRAAGRRTATGPWRPAAHSRLSPSTAQASLRQPSRRSRKRWRRHQRRKPIKLLGGRLTDRGSAAAARAPP